MSALGQKQTSKQVRAMSALPPIADIAAPKKKGTGTTAGPPKVLFERDIEKIVNAILEEMVEALRRGDRVELRGFGAFSVKLREARQGRNPRTGAVVPVAKKAVAFFKTGKEMRARLNPEAVPSD